MTRPLPDPGPERRALLAPFMGWVPRQRCWYAPIHDGGRLYRNEDLPPWDLDPAAAHEVIEAMRAKGWKLVWHAYRHGQEEFDEVSFSKFDDDVRPGYRHGALPFPDAVTAAALLALGECEVPR